LPSTATTSSLASGGGLQTAGSPRRQTADLRAGPAAEAARLAAFPVFALALPEQWQCYASYKPERPWKHQGPRPPVYGEAVLLDYHLADAAYQLHVVEESATDGNGEPVYERGVWESHEYDGHTTWVWTATEGSPGARRPDRIRLKREGTILTISSRTLEANRLLQLAGLLRRVV
jgi:hypothetical protein